MAILAAMQKAARRLLGQRPTAFFGVTNTFEAELCDLVNEVAEDVLKSNDWQALTSIAELSGDGATTEFSLPADYDRMLLVADVQDQQNWVFGYYPAASVNEFAFLEARGFTPWPGAWIIYGDLMRFQPAPASESTAIFPYIAKNFARDAGTLALKSEFTADTDAFLLPERLLTLGLVWRWRENKKLDFTGDQEAFTKALSEYAAKDKGSKVIRKGGRRWANVPGTYPAWPWALGGV